MTPGQDITPAKRKTRSDKLPFNPAIGEEILTAMTYGQGLGKVLEGLGISPGVFYKWLSEPGYRERYADARKVQAEIMATEIIQIADDASNDTYIDSDGRTKLDNAAVARARLRVDTRKWILSKVLPKVYGDKLAVTDADGQNLRVDISWLQSRHIGQVVDADVRIRSDSLASRPINSIDSITYDEQETDSKSEEPQQEGIAPANQGQLL